MVDIYFFSRLIFRLIVIIINFVNLFEEYDMQDEKPETKRVIELSKMNFFIPSYQRGYRWEEKEIKALLEDIDTFIPIPSQKTPTKKSWYCLQPVVVKELSDVKKKEYELSDETSWYELVDGQQRLTTIKLILHYFNQPIAEYQRKPEVNFVYEEVREDNNTFFNNLKFIPGQSPEEFKVKDYDNPDFYYIENAYKVIFNWFTAKNTSDSIFDENTFRAKFASDTRVLWYKLGDSIIPKNVFRTLNLGKIRLTDAELIKAILLTEDNLIPNLEGNDNRNQLIKEKQINIATEWDRIEHKLQNKDLFSFITKRKCKYNPRIQLLFELQKPEGYKYTTFDYFYTLSHADILAIWENTEHLFEIIDDWYNNIELFNKIGYLIKDADSITLRSLINIYLGKNSIDNKKTIIRNKKEFILYMDNQIKKLFAHVNLEDVAYVENSDNRDVYIVLDLFNILSCTNAKIRFPFSEHEGIDWTIEHIHAQNSETLNKREQWQSWLKYQKDALKNFGNHDDLVKEIETMLPVFNEEKKDLKEKFDELAKKINPILSAEAQITDEEAMHSIKNLALLSRSDNAAFNNFTFAAKRLIMIELDSKGCYLPICTKNVFSKYYNPDAKDFTFWTPKDRDMYFEKIKITLSNYLPKKEITECQE